ncbi:SAM-dependent methyltransferase [Amycolatopsis pigmentata]|uniref:SAM-dependent methyltransferase n=1 Tax=Amycolatopsis pigmentata TaxID=450801 RepID=A0ABW5FY62_9PSEU
MSGPQRVTRALTGVDLDHADAGRVVDYYLGGTSNWAIDRILGDQLSDVAPSIKAGARAGREFFERALRYCLRTGYTQFLDLGSGVSTVPLVHEIANEMDIESRCVYVDRDPVAVAHAQVVLEEREEPERYDVVHEDLRNVTEVWNAAMSSGVLDSDRPIALLMVSILHFLAPDDEVSRVIRTYRRVLPAGSSLVMSHCTVDGAPAREREQFHKGMEIFAHSGNALYTRSPEDLRSYFGDFELVEPGVVWAPEWRPEEGPSAPVLARRPEASCLLGGIGIKP